MEKFYYKGHVFYVLPTIGFWKNDYSEIIEEGRIHYGLQFNWFKWQIGIVWKKK